ncbi:44574_t:CDS:2 [Gigaspora margarita]|uniref:44574_t:CDS:1 n=1 Tax=Gigaspora margarita TaxID=4874 RepID=A0ABN7VRW8_GIGMA|nr:44574_t:CDS:2 [Gigaspora margarita]
MVLGLHNDRFWDTNKLLNQVQQAINIFKRTHPGYLFAFDNTTFYTAFTKDALVTSKMNLGPGDSVSKMRDTVWNGQCQLMIIEEDYYVYNKKTKSYINLHGQPKEIK